MPLGDRGSGLTPIVLSGHDLPEDGVGPAGPLESCREMPRPSVAYTLWGLMSSPAPDGPLRRGLPLISYRWLSAWGRTPPLSTPDAHHLAGGRCCSGVHGREGLAPTDSSRRDPQWPKLAARLMRLPVQSNLAACA